MASIDRSAGPLLAELRAEAVRLLLARLDDQHAGGCWVWTGSRNAAGYGLLRHANRVVLTHRLAYTAWVRPVPEGLDVDHLCFNRACCNPAHLEAVTRSVNSRRAMVHQRLLHPTCRYGHPKTEANTSRHRNGGAYCRVCHRIRQRERFARMRAAA